MSIETTKPATIEDLYNAPDDGMYELVDVKLVHMPLSGFGHNRVVGRIRDALFRYEDETGSGYALTDGIAFLVNLPHRQSFGPDAAYSFEKPENEDLFITGAPVFAAEVRSKNDYGPRGDAEATAKRDDYFAAGTLAVWDVDRRVPEIRLYTAENRETPRVFATGDTTDAEPALPGWRVAVADIFR